MISRRRRGISSTRVFPRFSPIGCTSAHSGEAITRTSEKKHWDRFWTGAAEAADVYSNEGRVAGRLADAVPLEGALVLEVGAGTGRDAVDLARGGARAVALDYSPASLGLVKSQRSVEAPVDLVCGDAFALPFPDETFDAVFHQGLLEHFRNPDDLIAENARVLKRGGVILVDVPQRWHYYTIVKHILIGMNRWFAGWEREYSVSELERMLERHGFSVIRSYGEWFIPPMWYRMLRRSLRPAGVSLPLYPRIFTAFARAFSRPRRWLLDRRLALYTTVVVGTVARKR